MKDKEIRKTKRTSSIVFLLIVLLVATSIVSLNIYRSRHLFTTGKWIDKPRDRVKIVDSLLSKHKLVGMTEAEILTLLGEDSGEDAYFQEDNNLVYYLGDERGFISIDSEWLIIEFTNGVVSSFKISTD